MKFKNNKGITIIELMIVVVIIGILTGIGYSRYRLATIKSKISEAVINVKHFQELQDAYYLEHGTLPHQDGTMLYVTDANSRFGGSWWDVIDNRTKSRLKELGVDPLSGKSRFWYWFSWWGVGDATKIIYAYPKTNSSWFDFPEEECDESLRNVTIAIDNDGTVYVWGVDGMEWWN